MPIELKYRLATNGFLSNRAFPHRRHIQTMVWQQMV
jgi:hypothetical protein